MTKRILFVSENLHLGGLAFLELARMRDKGEIELISLWSSSPDTPQPRMGKAEYEALRNAEEVRHTSSGEPGAVFERAYIANFATLASECEVPFHCVPDMNASSVPAAMKSLDVDLAIVCGHRQIFKAPTLQSPKDCWLNLHPSLLPRHRGPVPGFWELRHGETQSGVTFHKLTPQIDCGPILDQEHFDLEEGMTFQSMVEIQGAAAMTLIRRALNRYLEGNLELREQDISAGTYESFPTARDLMLSPDMSLRGISCFVQGLRDVSPVLFAMEGKLFRVDAIRQMDPDVSSGTPGDIEKKGPDTLRLRARDGWATILVSPYVPGDDSAKALMGRSS